MLIVCPFSGCFEEFGDSRTEANSDNYYKHFRVIHSKNEYDSSISKSKWKYIPCFCGKEVKITNADSFCELIGITFIIIIKRIRKRKRKTRTQTSFICLPPILMFQTIMWKSIVLIVMRLTQLTVCRQLTPKWYGQINKKNKSIFL